MSEETSVREGGQSESPKVKVHRHHQPEFSSRQKQRLAGQSILHRRFFACVDNYSAKRDHFIKALRIISKKRTIRSEQCETIRELRYALIKRCNYDIDGNLEVTAPVEELARDIGQLHEYENGRISMDPVYAALETMSASQQILWVREFSQEKKQHKAGRVFLLPNFFVAMGLQNGETADIIADFLKSRKKAGELLPEDERKLKKLNKVKDVDLANMKKWHIKRMERTTRRLFKEIDKRTSAGAIRAKEQLKDIQERIKGALDDKRAEVKDRAKHEAPDNALMAEIDAFVATIPPYQWNHARIKVRQQSPGLSSSEEKLAAYQLLKQPPQ